MIKLKSLLEISFIQSFKERGFVKEKPEIGDVYAIPCVRNLLIIVDGINFKKRFGTDDYLIEDVAQFWMEGDELAILSRGKIDGYASFIERVPRWFSQIAKGSRNCTVLYAGKVKNLDLVLKGERLNYEDIDTSK
jgi:hypothetical protein